MAAASRALLAACSLLRACAGTADAETCAAGGNCASGKSEHFWPSSAGRIGQYGFIPYDQPWDLPNTLKWSADYPVSAHKQSHSVTLGTAIDADYNVYVSSHNWIVKHDGATGEILWRYWPRGSIPDNVALYGDRVYGDSHQGFFYALDMKTGREIFHTKVATAICGDTGSVSVHDGVMLGGVDPLKGGEMCGRIVAANATDGNVLWSFKPDNPVWNIMLQFPDDGTTVFQDFTGRVYRLRLADGSLVWKNGGFPNSWTDGTQLLYEGIVYAVSNNGCGGPDCHGALTAYRLADGAKLWSADTPRPANAFPAVGRLGEGKSLSVVMPVGQQPSCEANIIFVPYRHLMPGALVWLLHNFFIWLGDSARYIFKNPVLPTDLIVYDAATGQRQWHWKGPTWYRQQCPGDEEDFFFRYQARTRAACCPNTWGGPRVSKDGTIFVGNQNGDFLAIKDKNGDGRIEEESEVRRYDTGAAFSGPGSAHAPGMIAVASCDTVFVFRS